MIAWAVREVLFGLGDVKKLFERFVCGERCELTDMLSDFFFSFFSVMSRCGVNNHNHAVRVFGGVSFFPRLDLRIIFIFLTLLIRHLLPIVDIPSPRERDNAKARTC